MAACGAETGVFEFAAAFAATCCLAACFDRARATATGRHTRTRRKRACTRVEIAHRIPHTARTRTQGTQVHSTAPDRGKLLYRGGNESGGGHARVSSREFEFTEFYGKIPP